MKRKVCALLLVCLLLAGYGCQSRYARLDASPALSAAPDVRSYRPLHSYEGWYLRLQPAQGMQIEAYNSNLIAMVLDSVCTPRLLVQDAAGTLTNRLQIYDDTGALRYTYMLASDGKHYIRNEYGDTYLLAPYAYYMLEETLWRYQGSLYADPLQWDPAQGTARIEAYLDELIKTALAPVYGYAQAYFTAYTIYGTREVDADTHRIYMLVCYCGYDLTGTSFMPVIRKTLPMALSFTRLRSRQNMWQLTGVGLPADSSSYDDVRRVIPFEYMEQLQEDIQNDQTLMHDVLLQATDYLRAMQLSGISVED